jgi:hypothetical protein
VNCCAQSCNEKATAVAKTAQTAMPIHSCEVEWKRIGCQRIAFAPNAVSHAITAHASTCNKLSAAAECSRA